MPHHVAVVGHPVAHSKSPALHGAAYNALDLRWDYNAIDVQPGGLAAFVQSLDESWVGLSVTMPHKTQALELSHSVDVIARVAGVVNTLVFSLDASGHRVIFGYNTDVAGIVSALADSDIKSTRETAIIGGGATAASAIVAAAELGSEQIVVLVRNVEHAESLLAVGNDAGVAVRIHDLATVQSIPPVDLVISTIPGSAELSLSELARTPSATLLDVAYSPWPSVRAEEWMRQTPGEPIIVSGLRMLAHQALVQVRLFHSGDASRPLADEARVRNAMFAAVDLT